MELPVNDYQILKLTDEFYQKYPNPPFTEILKKNKRAYTCILFQTHYDFYICVPFRSEITHKYAFHFKNSSRSKVHKSGLDYTKIIIIADSIYIDTKDATIDQDEYNETIKNLKQIKQEALRFVEEYITHINGSKRLHIKEFVRRYEFSSLKYFHKEMFIGDGV